MAKDYTIDEAYDIVCVMENMCSTMPTAEDYEKLSYIADVNDLAVAFGVEEDMKRLHVRAYAAVNIAVLQERRRRAGKPVHIVQAEESLWHPHGAVPILETVD